MSLRKYLSQNFTVALEHVSQITINWSLLFDSRKYNIAILFLSAVVLHPAAQSNYYESFFKIFAWKSDLLIIYERPRQQIAVK